MKTSTLIDANILVDVIGSLENPSRLWSLAALKSSYARGPVVFSAIVWAELCNPVQPEADLSSRFDWLAPRREDFPFAAADRAGRAHKLYRQRGGSRDRTLPDFLIGAHAATAGHRLLTRDPTRYRSYFPDLQIIAPDTHSLESFA